MTVKDTIRPLFIAAGIPEENHEGLLLSIGSFSSVLVLLMKKNPVLAPNHLTFAIQDDGGDSYSLTVQREGGKTPAEVIEELRQERDQLRAEVEKWEGKHLELVVAVRDALSHVGRPDGYVPSIGATKTERLFELVDGEIFDGDTEE